MNAFSILCNLVQPPVTAELLTIYFYAVHCYCSGWQVLLLYGTVYVVVYSVYAGENIAVPVFACLCF